MIDLELLLRTLQSCLENWRIKLLIFVASTALLMAIGLQIVMGDTKIERLLGQEAVVALIILLLFMVMKPRKPSKPQHPLPSHEPLHLGRRIKPRIADDGLTRTT